MKAVVIVLLAGAGLFVLDRLALWAERRGWIYYRKRRASPGTAASALLEVQSLMQPGAGHVIESRTKEEAEEDDSGDPPER